MGIYMNGTEELKGAMSEALDDVQGDFTRATLKKACRELADKYRPVSDEDENGVKFDE